MNIEFLYEKYKQYPSVQTDTRKLKPGDIYFALKGENFNGNHFTKQALEMGASFCVIDEKSFQINDQCILVDNVLICLQQLALHHRKQFTIPFIAITGSNGKTTSKELIHAVLSSEFKTSATIGNLNNHIGVPLTILQIPEDTEIAIIEMGANHQKEIASYCEIALPTHGLINNCGKAHLEGFGGIEGVKKGKGELYDFLKAHNGTIFRNTDLDYLKTMAQGIKSEVTYGCYEGDLKGNIATQTSNHNHNFLSVAILNHKMECIIQTQLVGDYNLANVLASVCIGHYFNIPIGKIKTAIESYIPSNSRSQLIQSGTNMIILDAYNANPTSMHLAIENFYNMPFDKKVIMIGGMKELGTSSIEEHQKIVSQIQERGFKEVVLVGGDFQYTQHPFIYFENSTLAQFWFKQQGFENTAILIKGSRAMAMENVMN